MAISDWHLHETYKSLLSISDAGFKYLAALNGGTWLSALVFASQLPLTPAAASAIGAGIELFVISFALTGLCYLLSYFTQLSLYNQERNKVVPAADRCRTLPHQVFLWPTAVCFIAAIACYALGAHQVKSAFFG